ncbi:hypothetical protein SLITO_v1c08690 [Spiroplasma litorale]|uniref:Ribosomal processing cysteine protease Prp n=1 Tax=Spiroplasma litorale TaxID=216942 RepID=A0A0K1W2C8_9MOLU|nr:ribosomal-processing cysteine protease Prp [Spiroplasma litorale]AKX34484.1 hypothetical protein SLITO_v1c08690 [Spiroplasma litorale]
MIVSEFYYKDKCVKSFFVKGHANYDNYNKDIVCSAVTAIVSGSLNAFDILYNKNVKINVEENKISVNIINSCNEINKIMEFLYIQLETVFVQYPKNFILKKVGE